MQGWSWKRENNKSEDLLKNQSRKKQFKWMLNLNINPYKMLNIILDNLGNRRQDQEIELDCVES